MGDDRPVREGVAALVSYPSLAYEVNRRFCERVGWDFRYEQYQLPKRPWGSLSAFSRSARQHRAASWVKILAVLRAFELGHDLVVWIDSDCIFYNHDADWESIIRHFDLPDVDFLSWVDRPFYAEQFCAGFFIVRNTDHIKAMFIDAWNRPSEYSWKHVYEQSELNKVVTAWPSSQFRLIDEPMFRIEDSDQKLLHIASFDHANRLPSFRDWFERNRVAPEPQRVSQHVHTDMSADQWDQQVSNATLSASDQIRREIWSIRQAIRRQLKRMVKRWK